MSASRIFERIVRAVTRRPVLVIALIGLLALAGGILALRLEPSAGTDTLVDDDSATFRATEDYHERFGDNAVLILVRGDLSKLVLTQDVERLLALEGCISGNVPRGVTPLGGPNGACARLGRSKPVQVVYGPGTFINEAVRQIQDEVGRRTTANEAKKKRAVNAARNLAKARGLSPAETKAIEKQVTDLVQAEFLRDTLRTALNYGIRSVPKLNDPSFVSQLVFAGANKPKTRFAYLFPNGSSALVQVRLRPELTDAERTRAIALIRTATRMPEFQPRNGAKYTVTGAPVVIADLTEAISDSILVLLLAAQIVMAIVLLLVFRSRLRLLPLAIALAAAGLTFGGMSLFGVSLTMASIAVLPVLIGLTVDYAIQFQSRFNEARRGGRITSRNAAVKAAMGGGPPIATAGLATAAGFLVLLLSPVPMVRAFGLLLVIGIFLAFLVALTAGFAVLSLTGEDAQERVPPRLAGPARSLAAAGRGAIELVTDAGTRARDAVMGIGAVRSSPNRAALAGSAALLAAGIAVRFAVGGDVGGTLGLIAMMAGVLGLMIALRETGARLGRRALDESITRPVRVLGIGVVLALAGVAADTQTRVVSDITKLVPQDLGAVRDLTDLQESTGVAGEVDVTVRADDLTDPKVIQWMSDYQRRLLRQYGYAADRGCGKAKLCPALSLPDLFRSGADPGDKGRIRALLDAVPPYFSQAVVTNDRKVATLAFGIKLMPLDEQQAVIESMRDKLNPPPGVEARVAGLPVLAAEANDAVSSHSRRLLTLLAGLLAVAVVLLLILRKPERALVPLLPIVLATGWSSLILFVIRIPLNPMTVTLGALVIAIATEFSVLLSERYRAERRAGHAPAEALARTYSSTGAAVLASGATAIAGFAVLIFSPIRMLRDFGLVTVVDLSVSLLGVLVVLPAVLLLAERGELATLPKRALLRVVRFRPRLRRPRAA